MPATAKARLPPLYEPDGNGGWRCNAEQYDAAEILAWVEAEYRACKKSPKRFIANWCYTINQHLDVDDGTPPTIELIPQHWPHVKAAVDAFFPARDVLIEKSRDMMASWVAMAAVAYDLMFMSNWPIMTLSRVESLVDDGGENSTVSSMHGKVRFIWDNLPPFFKPTGGLEFKHLSIRNPTTNAFVQGFSATPHAGRGPKWARALMDEFAWVPFSEQVMTSVARACPRGKALFSTPHGKANAFFRIRNTQSRQVFPALRKGKPNLKLIHCKAPPPRPEEAKRHFERYTIHWSIHPERDLNWYRSEVSKGAMTEEAVAQELDISYDRSVTGRVYPKFIYDSHVAGGVDAMQAPLAYERARPLYLCMDFNHDPLIWVIVQPYNDPPYFRVIGEICRRNATWEDACREFIVRFGSKQRVDFYLKRFADWTDRYGMNGICLAGNEGHQAPVEIYGDATEEKSTIYARTKVYGMIRESLENDGGFKIVMNVPEANPGVTHRLESVNDVLSKDLAQFDPSAEQLIKDFESGVWDAAQHDMDQRKKDDDGSGLTRSHASSAFGYMIVRKHKVATTASRPRAKAKNQDIAALINRW